MGPNEAADIPHPSNMTDFQFPDDLIPDEVQEALPPGYLLRPLHIDDHEKGAGCGTPHAFFDPDIQPFTSSKDFYHY